MQETPNTGGSDGSIDAVAGPRRDEPTGAFASSRWDASWIWVDDPGVAGLGDGRRTVAFRRVLTLDSVPDTVPARVFADSRYALHVNGTEVSRGPVRASATRRRFDLVDLAPHLRPGTNVVTALVCFHGAATPDWAPGSTLLSVLAAGGFVLESSVVRTDADWHARWLEGWERGAQIGISGRGREVVDLRTLPSDWRTEAGDDGWSPARVLAGAGIGEPWGASPPTFPFGPTAAAPLPRAVPRRIALVPDATEPEGMQVFHADEVVAGTVEMEVSGPEGSVVHLTFAERVDERGEPVDDEHTFGLTVTLDGTRRTFESFDDYGLRAVAVRAQDGAVVHSMTVCERLAPVTGAASFACSDPMLDRIWQVGRRTVSICSFDAYIDCPTREQRAWTGDAVVHQMVDLTTNDDWSLARWNPAMLAAPRPDGTLPMAVAGDAERHDITVIPDWALHWVHGLWNLHRYVGDRDEVAALLPVAEGVLRWFEPYLNRDGLLDHVIGWVIIDWASVHTEGASAALNGLWARALVEFAQMCEWLGDERRAQWARSHHERLRVAFEQFWDEDRGCYVDSILDGVRRPMVSQHAQAVAIVADLAPTDRWARLVDTLTDEARLLHATFSKDDGPAGPGSEVAVGGAYLQGPRPAPWWDVQHDVVRAQPFFRYVVHDALAAAGRADLIAAQCRDWAVLLERCDTSWSETWFGGTTSHGWSSTPTRDLTTRVLGVLPAAPGFTTARIDPHLGDLDWAEGTVPTPAGPLRVHVDGTGVRVSSPIPFEVDGQLHPAGTHTLTRTNEQDRIDG